MKKFVRFCVIVCVCVRCRVCAVSSGGQSAWSDEASFKTPPTLPRPPINVGVSGKVTLSSAIITWSKFKKTLLYTTKLFLFCSTFLN